MKGNSGAPETDSASGFRSPAGSGSGSHAAPGVTSPPPSGPFAANPGQSGPLIPLPPGSLDGAGALRPGVVLGKYQIVRALGQGGMGSVYEAIHTGIGRGVALKTMNPNLASDPRAEARFLREAAAASRLEHPHVVEVTDFGTDHGIIYLVMELMRGEDLAGLVGRAPAGLDAAFVADIMLPVCAGVFAAHEKGVVHRDLKPQNIFLSRTALGDVVPKVLDFGISKLMDEDVGGALTNSGSVMGTTHYLSPEQVTGAPIDGRSDEYALGVILYECLTGRRPHEGDTVFTIMRSISEGRYVRPRQIRPDLPPAFEAVLMQAMSVRPEDRFPSAHSLGRALLPFASPKGRVMWSEYFERSLGPKSGSLSRPHGPGPQSAPSTQWHPQFGTAMNDMGGRTSGMTSAPSPFTSPPPRPVTGGDTRSGVAPVSVMGSNELHRRRSSGGKRFVLGIAAIGLAAAAWFLVNSPKPLSSPVGRPGSEGPVPLAVKNGAGALPLPEKPEPSQDPLPSTETKAEGKPESKTAFKAEAKPHGPAQPPATEPAVAQPLHPIGNANFDPTPITETRSRSHGSRYGHLRVKPAPVMRPTTSPRRKADDDDDELGLHQKRPSATDTPDLD